MNRQRRRAVILASLFLVSLIPTVVVTVTAFQLPIQQYPQQPRRRQALSTTTTTSLTAKPKPKQLPLEETGPSSTTEIPANLRRKVQAKRPPLGHVVPKGSRANNRPTKVSVGGSASSPTLRPQGTSVSSNTPGLLKIAAGTARGRRLDSPTVYLRPMMGKVKEAVYSTFTSFGLYDTACCRHLDIFAGSGSVGLESLSRGAAHCTFVDFSSDCCACIQRNLELTGLGGGGNDTHGAAAAAALVCCADALTALRDPASVGIPAGSTYQIVTLCPPYEEVVYGDLLEAAVSSALVTDDTVVLIEYPVELGCLPHVVTAGPNTAVGVRNRRYGRTVIAMYVINPTGKLSDAASSRPEEFVQV